MSNTIGYPLLNGTGDRACCREDGPAVSAPALLDGTCTEGMVFCPSCDRAVLIPSMQSIHARCYAAPMLDTILALTVTPTDEEAAAMRILCPAQVELDATLSRSWAAMTSATVKVYCFTCKKEVHPSWWLRHMKSIGHVRRALGDPHPFVHPTPKPTGPCVFGNCENWRIGGIGDERMHCQEHQCSARPAHPGRLTARADAQDPIPTANDDEKEPERPLARLARRRGEARGDHA